MPTVANRTIEYRITAKDEASRTFQGISGQIQGLGAAISGVAIQRFARSAQGAIATLANKAGELQQLEIGFTTMLGSAQEAKEFLEQLDDFAKKTPFTLEGIQKSSKQLIAMGFAAEEVIPTMTKLGDLASGVGLNQEGLSRIVFNLGQIRAQGRATAIDLRQFAMAGIPIYGALAEAIGVSEAKVRELVSAGEIGFAEVEEALTAMTSEGGKFFNMMESQGGTFLQTTSNLEDSLVILARTLGEPLIEPLTKLTEKLIVFTNWVGEFVDKNPQVAKFAALFALLVTGIASIAGPALIALGLLAAMGVALAPAAAIAIGVGGLIALVAALIVHWDALKDSLIEVAAILKDNLGAALDWIMQKVKAVMAAIAKAMALANSIRNAPLNAARFVVDRVTGRQSGGRAGGMVTVGERGPETIVLPNGSRVAEAGLTRRSFGQQNADTTLNLNAPLIGEVHVTNEADENRLAHKIQESLANLIHNQNLRAA